MNHQRQYELDHADAFDINSLGATDEDKKKYLYNRLYRAVDFGYQAGIGDKAQFAIDKLSEARALIDKATDGYRILDNMISELRRLKQNPIISDYKK